MKRPRWKGERQRAKRFYASAVAILRERIEAELVAGDTPDEVRASARRARQVFHLPVFDSDLDRVLWDAVLRLRPDLMPEPGEVEAPE